MLFIASILMEMLAFLMLFAAGVSGYITYKTYSELPAPETTTKLIDLFMKTEQLRMGVGATVSCTVLFLGFMVAFAVIDTARHTRKVLDQLQRMEGRI